MPLQPVVVGGTYDWFLNSASINSEAAPNVYGAWNITGATVTITFMFFPGGPNAPPDEGQSFVAIITNGSNGQARFINPTTLFTTSGWWGYSWLISLSGTVLESQILNFYVFPSGVETA